MSACQHYIAIHVNAWKWFDFFTFDAMGKAARLPALRKLVADSMSKAAPAHTQSDRFYVG